MVWNANENCRPAARIPEFHPGASDVDVCASLSVFTHVTVVPIAMLRSFGTNARFPRNSAPTGIVTDEVTPGGGVGAGGGGGVGVGAGAGVGAGVGVGDGAIGVGAIGVGAIGDGEGERLPQAIANTKTAEMTLKRNDNMRSSDYEVRDDASSCVR